MDRREEASVDVLGGDQPALVVAGLGKRFDRRWVLRRVDWAVPSGRVVALVGANGAGKTTLLHLAVGLLKADEGEVMVLGREPREALCEVGFVAQDLPLYRRFRVCDLLTMGERMNDRWDRDFAAERLDELSIGAGMRSGELSGGQQAQVALCLALAKRPRLLVLDEPTAALDPLARRDFLDVVVTQAAQRVMTVVYSSHDVTELSRACDFLAVLRDGQVALGGDLATVNPAGCPLEVTINSPISTTTSNTRSVSTIEPAAHGGSFSTGSSNKR